VLAEGRTVAEVLETARRVFGEPQSITEKNAGFVQTLVVLKRIPGPWLSEPRAAEIRRVAREVVRGTCTSDPRGGAK